MYLESFFILRQFIKPLKEIQGYKYWVIFDDKPYGNQYNLTMLIIL